MSDPIIVNQEDAVTILSINDAPYNRMSLDFMDQLEDLVAEIACAGSTRAVVLTAEGDKNFSVGMNLKQFAEGVERKGSADALLDQRLTVIRAIETMGKPWIATLFGYCLGGGLELPLGCHFRLAASSDAQIGLPELDIGAVPAWGGSARLTKCVGEHHAIDMILRAKKISGLEAYRIGLVHEVHPIGELKAAAIRLAHSLTSMPAGSVRSMLNVIVDGNGKPLDELIQAERQAVIDNRGTADAREGMLAFLKKRDPVFNQT